MKKHLQITLLSIILSVFSVACSGQDWANLSRYQMDNKALLKSQIDTPKVVFMGNSITEGWPGHEPVFFQNPAYINRGISGQTTPQMLVRFRQDVIDLQPAAVVILAGINDIAGNTGPATVEMIIDNIISMAELAQANDIEVVLCSVLPAAAFPWQPKVDPVPEVLALNQMIKNYCTANDLIYVDYFSAMVDTENGLQAALTYDGVHPNKAGYEVMGPLVKIAINRILK
ncbi:SGNH/GDSL hydrolase family protein [Lewinella cohaerens]|uniref:SGNH/GDSL hydrolase family protein n=1 Tax=Lewinella cohaerens TaxID=70995 RepID=UPI00039DDE7B|nr:SGNH/GDSL hydrolase family protein [Lewinella cohaerens]